MASKKKPEKRGRKPIPSEARMTMVFTRLDEGTKGRIEAYRAKLDEQSTMPGAVVTMSGALRALLLVGLDRVGC